MRIVHFVQFGPRSCGLYETTKDLVLAERKCGIDACIVDVDHDGGSRIGLRDGAIVTADPDIAYHADVLVRHSLIPGKYQNIGIPIVMCLHGRPESSYIIASTTRSDIITAIENKVADARYKAFVTFWPEYYVALKSLVGDKLHVVPAMVDLEYYSGGEDQNFSGSKKILIADVWRNDVIPLSTLFGAARYVEKYDKDARIHIVGAPTSGQQYEALKPFLRGFSWCIGSYSGHMKNIRDWYASCDVVATPHTIATRVVREALASGTPVVASSGCKYTRYRADHSQPEEVADAIDFALKDLNADVEARQSAEKDFSSERSAKVMIGLCKSVMNKSRTEKKVFLDVGAHLGESVKRFYRQRSDAAEFDIYCFEPDPETFEKLVANVGGIPNVTCINAALGDYDGSRSLTKGHVNDGEGSTVMDGKLTGALSGSIDIACKDAEKIFDALKPYDYMVVKMNIEGAEYEILPYLVKSGVIKNIDELYVQMHSLKFNTESRIVMDGIELKFNVDVKDLKMKVFATTKGMASFAIN